MKKSTIAISGLFLGFLHFFAFSGEFIEMESVFIRTTGQSRAETLAFTAYNPDQDFFIKVQNGPEGYDRISSASVSMLLNEEEIFSANDFNQQVEFLEKPIVLQADNTIKILLTSKPGAALKITVYGIDEAPPSLRFTYPRDNDILNTARPTISLDYSDVESGVVTSTLQILINGTDKTGDFTITESSAFWNIPEGMELPEGANTLAVSVSDAAGNPVSGEIAFQVQTSSLKALPEAFPDSGIAPLSVRLKTKGECAHSTINWYRWDFDGNGSWDWQAQVARDFTRTFSQPGTYQPALEVTNMLGEKDVSRVKVTVIGPPPVAHAQALPTNGGAPLEVTFTGWGVKTGGTIISHDWDLDGDGTVDTSFVVTPPSPGVVGGKSSVTRTYAQPGTYNATLTVIDNEGQSATASAMTTVIEVGPPGSPTVTAAASPTQGTAPFTTNFTASATDPGGQIVLYEWDFENDGAYDWSSTTNGNTSHTYDAGGHFVAVCQVTDNDGMTSHQYFDIFSDISASLAIPESDRTFTPFHSETMAIRTTLSGAVPASVFLKNADGQIVRTLVDWTTRPGGSYTDLWDGLDDQGNLVTAGPYYAVMQYRVGNDIRTLDLTHTTGGSRYNPPRTRRYGYTIYPYGNVHLPLSFSVPRPSEITLFMGILWGQDVRLRTLLNRVPMAAGSYTFYWDGLTDDGQIPYQHSGNIIPGIWGYYLPDNAVWVKAVTPEITALYTTPSKFAPMSETCTPSGDKTGLTFTVGVSADVPGLRMKVFNIESGQQLYAKTWNNIGSGSHTLFWNGRDENERSIDEGEYRIGFCTVDEYGNESNLRYNLMKTLFSFATDGE